MLRVYCKEGFKASCSLLKKLWPLRCRAVQRVVHHIHLYASQPLHLGEGGYCMGRTMPECSIKKILYYTI